VIDQFTDPHDRDAVSHAGRVKARLQIAAPADLFAEGRQRPEDAEEVLLDVYMKAWKNAGTYSPDRGTVQAWLFTMARSVAIDRVRQRRARPSTLPLEFQGVAEPLAGDASPEQQSAASQRRRRVQVLLNELPPEQRDVVMLAFFGGLTHSELAGRLGQPLGTIKSRIHFARKLLKAQLERI